MSKLTLQPGRDINGNAAARWKRPAVTPRAATPSKVGPAVVAPLAPERKSEMVFESDRSFEQGVTDDITYLEGGGAMLHVEDHATGAEIDGYLDTTSDETVRRDTWAILNKLIGRIDRANARVAAKTNRLES
jgi:hypothetical protein